MFHGTIIAFRSAKNYIMITYLLKVLPVCGLVFLSSCGGTNHNSYQEPKTQPNGTLSNPL